MFKTLVTTLIAAQLLAPTCVWAVDQTPPLPPALANNSRCKEFLHARAKLEEVRSLLNSGELNFSYYDPNHKIYDALGKVAIGGLATSVPTLFATAATIDLFPKVAAVTRRVAIGSFAVGAAAFVLGQVVWVLDDSDREQVNQAAYLLAHPQNLFSKSDFQACNDLLEYPDLLSEVRYVSKVTQHMLDHHMNDVAIRPSVETASAPKRTPSNFTMLPVAAPVGSNTVLR